MSDRLGTARWEEQSFVSERYGYEPASFWLGRAEDLAGIGYRDDRHICLVSGSRGGKGTSIIVNNLCLYPGSAVVIDPKGENASVTAARRGRGDRYCEGMGQAVHVLDPFKAAIVDDSYRSAFNPLDTLHPNSEESIDEASRLANALVVVKDDRADPFFDESARAMVRGVILHVLTADDFEPQERTLLMVRDLLKRGEFRIAQRMRDLGAEELDPPHQLLWRSMELNEAFGNVIAGDGSRFLSMMTNAGKTFESVLQSALVNTEFLDSPGMRRTLDHSDFKLSSLKTNPAGMTLYLSLPQRYMDTHYRWLRMMVALVTTEMEITRGRPATGYPVLMVLDEFAGLKRMTAIENAVAQIAGFGVKLFFVLQSLEQLKYIYKDNWETFLSNAGLKIFFSIEDHFTRDYVSKLMGETEIIREMRSTNEGRSESESFAEGRSQSQTQSRSTTRGTSETLTAGTSQSRTAGTSRSTNRSQSEGENWSENQSRTQGTSQSDTWSEGTSQGTSFRRKPFLFLFSTIDRNSVTESSGVSSSFGGSTGTSDSTSAGTSRGGSRGTSTGATEGTSDSLSDGRSTSRARGTSQSETEGASSTTGTSQTTTRGTGRTYGSGTSQTLHRRPLLRPEEFGKLFARIDDPAHPAWPGFGLVLVTGRDPFVVKRTPYFADPLFIETFTPHPDHSFTPAIETRITEARKLIDALEAANDGKELTIAAWSIEPRTVVESGQPAGNTGATGRPSGPARSISIRRCCGAMIFKPHPKSAVRAA